MRPLARRAAVVRHYCGVSERAGGQAAEGDVLELSVGEAAAGGWCVARPDAESPAAGLVIFVRHALPGERVRAVITQLTTRFARADAIAVLSAAPERVTPPCPYARPGGCGGCDWQHASLPAQRAIKAGVVRAQLRRIAGIECPVTVEAVPGDSGGLGWRTRVRFAIGRDGMAGFYRHRSHDVVPVTDCLIAHPLVTEAAVTRQQWPGGRRPGARWVEVAVAPGSGERAVIVGGGPQPPGPRFLTQRAAGRDWRVAATGFWQVHPGAADALAEAVITGLRPRAGETALDLYCGAGLFAGVLAQAVGEQGTVIGVEQDEAAVRDARHNLRPMPWARVHRGDAAEVVGRIGTRGAAVAVLDPPRSGAGPALIGALCGAGDGRGAGAGRGAGEERGAGAGLRRIAYVSCDPATLARDIAEFGRRGWALDGLRAFDAFPMTHLVECLALLTPAGGTKPRSA